MWIRSKSRKELINANRLLIEGNRILSIPNTSSEDTFDLLGEYDTEQRALEVLDMIQERIVRGTEFDEIYCGKKTISQFVFQMPQE